MRIKRTISMRAIMAVMEKSRDVSKLTRKVITDKNGHKKTVFVKNHEDIPDQKGKQAETPAPAGRQSGAKPGSITTGDTVTFSWEGTSFTGNVVSAGRDGVKVYANGMNQNVSYENITNVQHKPYKKGNLVRFRSADGVAMTGKIIDSAKDEFVIQAIDNISRTIPRANVLKILSDDGPLNIEPKFFKAAEIYKKHDNPDITADDILKSFDQETKNKIQETIDRNKVVIPTEQEFRTSGEGAGANYSKGRRDLHHKIFIKLLSPDKIRSAKPKEGESPKILMLGGRGGSGKSWFKIDPKGNPGGGIYDSNEYVVLDADEIKAELIPPYGGWNANQVHEESSDILEKMLWFCKKNGLNVVIDATMKTAKTAIERVKTFKEAGYRTEAHYMFLPREEASKRAINRFKTKEGNFQGRFVPPAAVLANKTNEESFDLVKEEVDAWSFRDNYNTHGKGPVLLAQYEKP